MQFASRAAETAQANAIVITAASINAGRRTVAVETPASAPFADVFDKQNSADEAGTDCRKHGKDAEFMPHDQMGRCGLMHFRCV